MGNQIHVVIQRLKHKLGGFAVLGHHGVSVGCLG